MSKAAAKSKTVPAWKMILLVAIVACGAIWISLNAYWWLNSGPKFGSVPTTGEMAEALELSKKLKEDHRFRDLEIAYMGEGKWTCTGSVRSSADAAAAEARARELKGNVDWTFELPVR